MHFSSKLHIFVGFCSFFFSSPSLFSPSDVSFPQLFPFCLTDGRTSTNTSCIIYKYLSIIINDTDSGIECALNEFIVDTKLSGAVDTPEGRDAIQRDPDKLKQWACAKLTKFNKAKCKALHMG